jgi:hypothetical protein
MAMDEVQDKVIPAIKKAAEAAEAPVSRAAGWLQDGGDINVGSGERLLSVAGGFLLLGWGAYRRGLLGYGAMATAAALLDRGIRGHCAINSALGRNSADATRSAESAPPLP